VASQPGNIFEGGPKMSEWDYPPAESTDEKGRQEIAAQILVLWRALLENILGVGKLLIAAKDTLPHGQWLILVKKELPFGPTVAQRLMRIAKDARLTNAAHAPHLPPCWTVLYEISRLSDAQFEWGIEHHAIHPEMERADVAVLRSLQGDEAELTKIPRKRRSISDEEEERLPIHNPLADARKGYFVQCRKLSPQARLFELKRCVIALISSDQEQIAVRRLRQLATEKASLRQAEIVAELWQREDQDTGG
jgi:hypothetical protein